MALVLPAWSFAYCTNNQPSTPSMAAHGTGMTPGTSSADGTAVSLISAITHDVHRLCVYVSHVNVSTAAVYTLMDILIDPAGGSSWASFIDDLTIGFTINAASTTNPGCWFDFPVFIPAGTSIGARARTSHTSAPSSRVSVWAFGEPSRPEMWWCGQGVETLGVTAGTSRGTSVPTGNASYGSWTSVGSTTTRRYGAISLGTNGTDATSAAADYHFQIGRGSQPLAGIPLIIKGMTSNESGASTFPGGPNWCDIESGVQLQVRGKGSSASFESWDCALYGVY